jgi:hypothetical protein
MTFWHSRIGLTGSDGRWLKNELVIEREFRDETRF